MGVSSISRGVIAALRQTVLVNGLRSASLFCSGIRVGSGAGGTTASFEVPQYLWDTAREGLRDALVTVYLLNAHDGSAAGAPDFVGYLDTDSGSLNSGDNTVSFEAHTITSYLDKVFVGQADHKAVVTYRLEDPETGAPTNWTPKRVLQDLFANLPSFYRARLELGVTSVLDDSSLEATPELVFRNSTYASALDSILGLYGDVAFRERFQGVKSKLDFYRIADATAPRAQVRVAQLGEDAIAEGVNVEEISENLTSRSATTRVIAYGSPRRFIVSLTNYDGTVARRLVEDWDASLEATVLVDPKRAKPGAPGYVSGMEHVFRRWRLPAVFKNATLERELPVRRANGQAYGVQMWYYPTVLAEGVTAGTMEGTVAGQPVLVKSVKLDLDRLTVTAGEPLINVTLIQSGPSSTPAYTYAEASVGVTLAFHTESWLYHDTGHDAGSDVRHDFRSDGLVETVQMDSLEFAQYTNAGYALGGLSWGALVFNEDDPTAAPTAFVSATEIRDDGNVLRQLARQIQREKSHRSRGYSVTVPYFSRAYKPGYRMGLTGQRDYRPGVYMITGVEYGLEDQSTTITVDNAKPPHRREIRGAA